MNFYNDISAECCAWLRELIADGLIPPGDVDQRSITEIQPDELTRYTSCHFFAGLGGWPYALRLAGWPDDRPVWTGSCPCPPFSCAGKKKFCPECGGRPIPHPRKTGVFACVECAHEWHADARHLWPEFLRLISECQPATVFGEQVSGADGQIWLAGVRATLEAVGYGVGALDTCSAGVGSPNIRQRLYWVGYSLWQRRGEGQGQQREIGCAWSRKFEPSESGGDHWLADAQGGGLGTGRSAPGSAGHPGLGEQTGGLGNADLSGSQGRSLGRDRTNQRPAGSPSLGYWGNARTILCADGKTRRIPVEPEIFPLASGVPGRVGLLRGSGNAICAPLAAQFIEAANEAMTP